MHDCPLPQCQKRDWPATVRQPRPWAVLRALVACTVWLSAGVRSADAQPPAPGAAAMATDFAPGIATPAPDASVVSGRVRIEQWTAAQGLPSEAVSDLAQDGDGFVWVAAGGFLARIEGSGAQVIGADGGIAASSRRIIRVRQGRADTLWLLDEAGGLLARVGGQVQRLAMFGGVTEMAQGDDGELFGISGSTLWRLHANGTVPESLDLALGTPGNLATKMSVDKRFGPLLVDDSGRMVRLTGPRDVSSRTAAPAVDAAQLVVGPGGRAYGVRRVEAGLVLLDAEGTVVGRWPMVSLPPPVALLPRYVVSPRVPLALDASGWLWVAERDGYRAFAPGSPRPVAFVPLTVEPHRVRVLVGRSGCVWLADIAVRRICPVAARTVAARLRTGNTFTTGNDGTVMVWDSTSLTVAIGPDGQRSPIGPRTSAFRFARAYLDHRGSRWWSLSPNAAPSAERNAPGTARLLGHRGVTRLALIPESDQAWYAVSPWLYRVRLPAIGPAVVLDSVDARGQVTHIAVDSTGRLWATVRNAELRGELLIHGDGHRRHLGALNGFPDVAFRVVRPDNAGGAWIGTYGQGLLHYSPNGVRQITSADGLGEDVVTSLLDDGLGNLWMHGNRTVHRVSWKALDEHLAGTRVDIGGVTYGPADGLVSPETIGSSGVNGAPGQLWFPTIAGPAVLDVRAALLLDSAVPRVQILGLHAERFGEQPLGAEVRLPLGARRIRVRFDVPDALRPSGVRYAYRIDGLDNRWLDAGTSAEAVYSGLPPGRHLLRVRATGAGGVPSEADATLRFMVAPYVYETPLFLTLALLTTVVAVAMALRLRDRQVRTRERVLEHAVHDRTRHLQHALQTVESQAAQLLVLNETRTRILANVSHELRTPLSLIIGPTDDLLASAAEREDAVAAKRLGVVSRNAHRLHELVEQLLDAARLEAGAMPVVHEVHDLVPLLRRLADSFSSLADQRDISFRLSCPVGGLRVRCAADHLEKIVGNLVGNALKFTPEGGTVELRARRADVSGSRLVTIEVSDTGAGIAAGDQTLIFERFHQLGDALRRTDGGTGIGLALVKELVELHGGTVEVQSVLGAGSTFTVRLPAETTGVFAAPLPERTPPVVAGATAVDAAEDVVRRAAPERAVRPRLLLVEDNEELRDWLAEHLMADYDVVQAEHGAHALELARVAPPDVLVSDVMMPVMDGLTLCAEFRSDPALDCIPIVLLTARVSREAKLSGLRDGADDYIAKPVDLGELSARIANLVESRRRVRQQLVGDVTLPSMAIPIAQPPRDDEDQRLLDAFTEALTRHLADEQYTANAMARTLGMSRSSLYRRLQPLLGRSPVDALWEYRLLQAAQWLAQTEISVSEIAYGVGFKSVPHFSARFRERFGETPSKYRTSRVADATTGAQ